MKIYYVVVVENNICDARFGFCMGEISTRVSAKLSVKISVTTTILRYANLVKYCTKHV